MQYLHHQNIVHGNIKPQNVLVCGATENDFVFKITDYACNMISGASCLSSKSASFKQLMTPGYLAPELIENVNFSMQPTTKSDVYSLAILIYEVFVRNLACSIYATPQCCTKCGHRPTIPDNSPQCIVQLIQNCWKRECFERPNICEISQQL